MAHELGSFFGAVSTRLRRLWGSRQALDVVGMAAAVVLVFGLNLLASRFYRRWDFTPTKLYTISEATRQTLRGLATPVDVVIFLGKDDPLYPSVRHMLVEYVAESSLVRPRYVDPDRDPAEFIRLQNEYGIFHGKTQEGRLVTETSIVIAQGPQSWLISADDLVHHEGDEVRPELEQALTEGLRRVLDPEPWRVCLSTGHRELEPSDGGPRGGQELQHLLERDNFEVMLVDGERSSAANPFEDCKLLIVPGPATPWSERAVNHIERYFEAGGAVLIALSPIVDRQNRVISSGFERFLGPLGLQARDEIVVERVPERILAGPGGGAVFFAEPKPHPITQGLLSRAGPEFVRLELTRPFTIEPSSSMQPLLVTTDQAQGLENLGGRSAGRERAEPQPVAVAWQRDSDEATPRARLVVFGTSSLLENRVWQDAQRAADRAFVESALGWLTSRPSLLSLPARAAHPAGLGLTEESLAEVQRYVLLYMPLTAFLLGLLTLHQRKRRQLPRPSPPKSSAAPPASNHP